MSRSLTGGVAMLVVCAAWSVAAVEAAPPGYASDIRPGADGGVSALAYGPDGTLYVADTTSGAVVRYPPGGDPSVLNIVGATLQSVGGMCVSPDASTLYITDNKAWGDGEGDLYAVDLLSGAVTTLVAGMDFIDDVAVRHTGEVFISEAAGPGAGGVYLVVGSGGGVVPVVSGLDYAAGLAFDSAGDLIYQQATSSFVGEVFRLPVTQTAEGLAFGQPRAWPLPSTWPPTARTTSSSPARAACTSWTATGRATSWARPVRSRPTASQPRWPSWPAGPIPSSPARATTADT